VYETPETSHDAPESPYPWAAIAAVAIAAGIIGTLFGYLYGYNRGMQVNDLAAAEFAAGMTEGEVVGAKPETTLPDTGITRESLGAEADPPAEQPATTDPVPPAPAPTGRLVIRSEPDGALVTIDGRLEGATPVTVTDLPFGEYAVQIARPGYLPHTETLSLSSSAPARTLSVQLDAGAEAVPVTTGSLVFDSRPQGADIRLDGRLVGTTPFRLASVAVGEHTVRLELAGYRSVSTQVTVAPGRQARVAVTLEPAQPPGRR